MELPRSRAARLTLGGALVVAGGVGGFLPILGYWMVPLGLLVLASDVPVIRRFNRRVLVTSGRWWQRRRGRAAPSSAPTNSP